MGEKKEYRSAIRSRKWIRQAFLELLEEKEFKKITVTDIVNRADINRSTFYVHYEDIYALVDEIENEVVNRSMELTSKLTYRSIMKEPMLFLKAVTEPLEENRELYALLSQTDFAQNKMEKIKEMYAEHFISSSEVSDEMKKSNFFKIRIQFFVGGIMNIYQQWMQGKLDCPLDEVTEGLAELIAKSTGDILETDWLNHMEKV